MLPFFCFINDALTPKWSDIMQRSINKEYVAPVKDIKIQKDQCISYANFAGLGKQASLQRHIFCAQCWSQHGETVWSMGLPCLVYEANNIYHQYNTLPVPSYLAENNLVFNISVTRIPGCQVDFSRQRGILLSRLWLDRIWPASFLAPLPAP